MITRSLGRALAPAMLASLVAAPLAAQNTIGIGTHYMGYSFDEGLGADAAQLLVTPLALRVPLSDKLAADLAVSYAQGKVERDNTEFTMQGVTNTRVRLSYAATPWALVSVGASLPTGEASLDGQGAIVAAVLATDLLGFREATLGTGLGFTSSVATAARVGAWGVGLAGAYSVRTEFEPSAEAPQTYRPGNETRVRVGLDRNIGTNTLTLGATFRTYSSDKLQGVNYFQAGQRLRFDATYAFRAGGGIWTLYGANVTRTNGDLTLEIVDNADVVVGDTTIATAKQNLTIAGMIGSVNVGGGFVFRPHIDFKYQTRTEADGSDPGSGWILGAGGDFPVRVFGAYDFFPKARILYGTINDATGAGVTVMGAELSATVRWIF